MVKKCTKCKEDKSISEFYKHPTAKDNLDVYCKACRIKASKEYVSANKDKVRTYKQQYGILNRGRLSEEAKAERKANPEKYRDADRKRWARDREKRNDLNRERRKKRTAEQIEKDKAYSREWGKTRRKASPVKAREQDRRYRAKHAVKLNAAARARQKANPEQWRVNKRNRKARLRNAEGAHTRSDIEVMFKKQKGVCVVCRTSIREKYHVDHIVPLVKGGHNGKSNLQLLCPTCNLRKHDKNPIKFMQENGYLL